MNYFGGKNQTYVFSKIINEMPPHECYVEAFGGSAAVMFQKRPAAENFLIELDPKVLAAAQSRLTARAIGAHRDAATGYTGLDGTFNRDDGAQFKFLKGDALTC